MDMREEFELHYAEEFAAVRGYKPTPEEMVSMRDGDSYGSDRGYLNGYWKGWQESRAKLIVKLPDSYRSAGSKFELLNKDHMIIALTELGIRTK